MDVEGESERPMKQQNPPYPPWNNAIRSTSCLRIRGATWKVGEKV